MTATTDEIREALEHNAERDTKGRWHFVFGNEPGAWGDAGPCGKAGVEEEDRMNEYLELQRRADRIVEVGPNG